MSAITAATFLLLVGLMRQGSTTITRQQRELERQVAELDQLLEQNAALSKRVKSAVSRTATLNERFLRRISAELHDGPAQDVSFALLKLDSLASVQSASDVDSVQLSLARATGEIRSIAAGLRLPELALLSLSETAKRALREQERRTGHEATLALGPLPENASLSLKITLYRTIQESLTNTYRHAGECAVQVTLSQREGELWLDITDDGRGFDDACVNHRATAHEHLGLIGMRERAQSLGGVFTLHAVPGRGTRVSVRLPLDEDLMDEDLMSERLDTKARGSVPL